MLLKEKLLEDFTKEEMLGVAKHLGLNKVSSLKKDALIEKIVERFCSEDELRRRIPVVVTCRPEICGLEP